VPQEIENPADGLLLAEGERFGSARRRSDALDVREQLGVLVGGTAAPAPGRSSRKALAASEHVVEQVARHPAEGLARSRGRQRHVIGAGEQGGDR
jgi:hypothetical protein